MMAPITPPAMAAALSGGGREGGREVSAVHLL